MSIYRELPPGWIWASFGDVAVIESNLVDPKLHPGASHIAPNHIESKTGRLLPYTTVATDQVTSPKHQFRPGQILYSKIRPYLAKAVYVDFEGLCSADMYPVSTHLEPRYLLWWLLSDEFTARASLDQGRTVLPKVNQEALNKMEVPVPPLNEQRRLVAKLEALFARSRRARESLDAVPILIELLRQSVLAAATSGALTAEWRRAQGDDSPTMRAFEFDDTGVFKDYSFPASWRQTRLDNIASISSGITKDSKKQFAGYEELPYLRVANVQRGFLKLSDMKTIRVPREKVEELLLKVGDILFNEGGDIDKLGRGWVWGGEIPRCVFQNHVFRARLHDPTYSPKFFSWYGNSRGHNYFLVHGKQTTNLASINKLVLSTLPVPVPPSDEQHEIVRRVEALLAHVSRLESYYQSASTEVERLMPTILARAFQGELVPQDPNDEPASTLLERIRTERALPRVKPKRTSTKMGTTVNKGQKAAIRDTILAVRGDSFSFEELREQVPGDYDTLKDAVFELLDEPQPVLKQIFDVKAQAVRLVRVRS